MFNLKVETIGAVAVVHCKGRIVRSEAAFQLRDAVTAQKCARVIVLDFSGVQALEGGGLGMLLFLQVWIHSLGIQLKVFAPTAAVRQSLERTRAAAVEIAGMSEVGSLLGQYPGARAPSPP